MALVQSRHSHYSRPGPYGYPEEVYPWKCKCDFCNNEAYKHGETAGDAADMARKDGFVTVPGKTASQPSRWACKSCKEKLDKAKK